MKYFLFIVLAGILAFSCGAADNKTTDITTPTKEPYVQVVDVPAGEDSLKMVFDLKNQRSGWAKLVGMYEDQRFIADSAKIDDHGHFVLAKKNLIPKGFYYWILPGQKTAFQFLVDKDQRFEISGDMADILHTAHAKGSECVELFLNDLRQENKAKYSQQIQAIAPGLKAAPTSPGFKKAHAAYNAIMDKMEAEVATYQKKYPNNFFTKFKVGGQNPRFLYPLKTSGVLDTARQVYDYRMSYWRDYDFAEADLIRTPVFSNKMKRFFTEMIPLHQDSVIKYTDYLVELAGDSQPYFRSITNWVALKYEPGHTNLMDAEAVYTHIIMNYFTDEKATWTTHDELEKLREHAKEMIPSLLGKKAGNVTAKDIYGKSQTLLDSKAPVLVVFIYSPDCEHCRAQTPKLINLYNTWHARGVDVFSIAANTTDKEWREFNRTFKMPWHDVFDETNASWYPKYFVDITPEVYVIDRNRKIVTKNIKVDQLPIVLPKYLK